MSIFDKFINSLDDAEEPKLQTGNQCSTCKHFTPLNLPELLIEGVGDCSFWEEGMTPDDICSEWEPK